jgi:argininosuccinate lyase
MKYHQVSPVILSETAERVRKLKEVDTMGKPDWERFGRASKANAPEIVELNQWRDSPIPLHRASYCCQVLIHRAHVVMLAEEGIIGADEAVKILRGLKDVEKDAEKEPRLVDYMSTETALINKIGEIGGRMHIGRSRNDLRHTQFRLFYRNQVERLIGALIEFRRRLLRKAEENLETVMPGYTHWRQAQPIVLAHYIVSHVDAAGRTLERLEDVYKRTNLNTLGAAAFAGTGWPVNRHRTMELLGFDALCENSHDSVAAIDYLMEFAAAIAIHMSNLSRLAEDLQIWSSDEYQLVDLDEAYAGTSSIMPQKKNPILLERVKSYAAEAIGDVVSVLTSMKGVSYTFSLDYTALEPVRIDSAIGCTNAMAGVTETITPLKENMLKTLRIGFSTMTDLADTLVRIHHISFRQAHDIISDVTLRCLSEDRKAEDITIEMINESSKKVIGKNLEINEEDLRSAVDPTLNVLRRKVTGGPAPESVEKMIELRSKALQDEEKRHKSRRQKINRAIKKIDKAEKALE